MTLEDIYTMLNGVEGGADAVASLKKEITSLRNEAKENRLSKEEILNALNIESGEEGKKQAESLSELAKKLFVSEVFEHVFMDKHLLATGYKKLDPSYYMAVSFQRLMQGNYNEADVLLLRHEHLERALEKRYNLSIRDAHNLTVKKYDYAATFKTGGNKKWFANSKRLKKKEAP